MKKFLLIFAMSLFTCNIFPNFAYAGEIYTEPDAIYTRAYNVHFDKQKGLFIIPADKKNMRLWLFLQKTGK